MPMVHVGNAVVGNATGAEVPVAGTGAVVTVPATGAAVPIGISTGAPVTKTGAAVPIGISTGAATGANVGVVGIITVVGFRAWLICEDVFEQIWFKFVSCSGVTTDPGLEPDTSIPDAVVAKVV